MKATLSSTSAGTAATAVGAAGVATVAGVGMAAMAVVAVTADGEGKLWKFSPNSESNITFSSLIRKKLFAME